MMRSVWDGKHPYLHYIAKSMWLLYPYMIVKYPIPKPWSLRPGTRQHCNLSQRCSDHSWDQVSSQSTWVVLIHPGFTELVLCTGVLSCGACLDLLVPINGNVDVKGVKCILEYIVFCQQSERSPHIDVRVSYPYTFVRIVFCSQFHKNFIHCSR